MPITPFIGVRISWLMAARNSDFARLADELDRIAKDGEAGEDETGRAEKELESVTGRYVAQIDEMVKGKEAELLEV